MKKTIQLLFVFALLLFVTPQINAQDLYNGSGNRIGKIDSDGTVRNSSGNGVGKNKFRWHCARFGWQFYW